MPEIGEIVGYDPFSAAPSPSSGGGPQIGDVVDYDPFAPQTNIWGEIEEVGRGIPAGAVQAAGTALRGVAANQPTQRYAGYLDQIEHGVLYRTREREGRVPIFSRPARRNVDGSISTELSVTVPDPRTPGQWINIPSMYGGEERSEDEALAIVANAGFRDPETGRAIESFPTVDEAVAAARARSDALSTEPPVTNEAAYVELLRRIADDPGMFQSQKLWLRHAIEGVRSGNLDALAEARSKLPPAAVQERELWRAGEAVSEFAEENFPAKPGYEDSLGRAIGEGLGSLGAGLTFGAIPGVGSGLATTFFTAMGSGEAADRAVAAGATDEQIIEAAGYGAGAGATDILPAEMLLGRIPGGKVIADMAKRFGGKRVMQALGRISNQALVESAQEGGQQALQNLIAQEIYKPEQQILEGVVENAGIGGIVGGIAGLGREGVYALSSRRSGSARGDRARAVREVPPPSPADEASPIPTADIIEGRERIADAEATESANKYLEVAGLPQIGQPVRIVRGRDAIEGVVSDAWEGDDPGLTVRAVDGTETDLSVAQMQQMGATLTGLPMPAPRAEIESKAQEIAKDAEQVRQQLAKEGRLPQLTRAQVEEVTSLTRAGVPPGEAVQQVVSRAGVPPGEALPGESPTGAPPGDQYVPISPTAEGFGRRETEALGRQPPGGPASTREPGGVPPGDQFIPVTPTATGFGAEPAPREGPTGPPPGERYLDPNVPTAEGFGTGGRDPRAGTGPRRREPVIGPLGQPERDTGPPRREPVIGPLGRPEDAVPETRAVVVGPQGRVETGGPDSRPVVIGPSGRPDDRGPDARPVVVGPDGFVETGDGPDARPIVVGPDGQPRALGPRTRPVVVGPSGRLETSGPDSRPLVIGPGGFLIHGGPNARPVIIGPQGKVEGGGPPDRAIVVGPSGRLRVRGPDRRGAVAGPKGKRERRGPERRGVVVGPQGRLTTSGPDRRPIIVGPDGFTPAMGPDERPVVIGPSGQLETMGPDSRPVVIGPDGRIEGLGPETRPEVVGPAGRPEPDTGPSTRPVVGRRQERALAEAAEAEGRPTFSFQALPRKPTVPELDEAAQEAGLPPETAVQVAEQVVSGLRGPQDATPTVDMVSREVQATGLPADFGDRIAQLVAERQGMVPERLTPREDEAARTVPPLEEGDTREARRVEPLPEREDAEARRVEGLPADFGDRVAERVAAIPEIRTLPPAARERVVAQVRQLPDEFGQVPETAEPGRIPEGMAARIAERVAAIPEVQRLPPSARERLARSVERLPELNAPERAVPDRLPERDTEPREIPERREFQQTDERPAAPGFPEGFDERQEIARAAVDAARNVSLPEGARERLASRVEELVEPPDVDLGDAAVFDARVADRLREIPEVRTLPPAERERFVAEVRGIPEDVRRRMEERDAAGRPEARTIPERELPEARRPGALPADFAARIQERVDAIPEVRALPAAPRERLARRIGEIPEIREAQARRPQNVPPDMAERIAERVAAIPEVRTLPPSARERVIEEVRQLPEDFGRQPETAPTPEPLPPANEGEARRDPGLPEGFAERIAETVAAAPEARGLPVGFADRIAERVAAIPDVQRIDMMDLAERIAELPEAQGIPQDVRNRMAARAAIEVRRLPANFGEGAPSTRTVEPLPERELPEARRVEPLAEPTVPPEREVAERLPADFGARIAERVAQIPDIQALTPVARERVAEEVKRLPETFGRMPDRTEPGRIPPDMGERIAERVAAIPEIERLSPARQARIAERVAAIPELKRIPPKSPAGVPPGEAIAAAEAATETEPSEAQKEAGNYRKGKFTLHGMEISIETPKGAERSGVGADGQRWAVQMPASYGYIRRTEGADGEQVDVYVGPEPEAEQVFVVDQVDADTQAFDEHKVMVGYPSVEAALADYDAAFDDGRGPERRKAVTPMSVEGFKRWLEEGDTKRPVAPTESAALPPDSSPAVERTEGEEGLPSRTLAPPPPILRKDGSPFKTRQGAVLAARSKKLADAEPVEVEGGWAIQPAMPAELAPTPEPRGEPEPTAPPVAAAPEPDLIRRANGEPFKTRQGAVLAARNKKIEAEPIEVDGGWALQQAAGAMPAAPSPTPPAAALVPEGQPQPEAPPVEAETDAPVELDGGLYRFDPATVTTDATAFQYKSGGDDAGVTERLQGIKTWDPVKAGIAIIYERADGTKVIADGHQRLGLAKRMMAEGQAPKLFGVLRREVDGWTEAEVRAEAALKNIAEGSGDAFDAATVLRDAPKEALDSLPPQSNLVRTAKDIARLEEGPFRAAKAAGLPAGTVGVVGRVAEGDGPLQQALIEEFADRPPPNVAQAEAMARMFREDRTANEQVADLFGESEVARSNYRERARIIDGVIRRLKQDKRVFATLSRNAEQIQDAGNVLGADNEAIADAAGRGAFLVQQLATRTGEISDAVKTAASDVDAGKASRTQAIDTVVGAVRSWVDQGGSASFGLGRPAEPAEGDRQAAQEADQEGDPDEVVVLEGQEAMFQRTPGPPLRATHSLSIPNLRSAVERGTLIGPSVAVTPAEVPHQWGGPQNVEVVFKAGAVKPGRWSITRGDAWTATVPQVTTRIKSHAAQRRAEETVTRDFNEVAQNIKAAMPGHMADIADGSERAGRVLIDGDGSIGENRRGESAAVLAAIYQQETGGPVPEDIRDVERDPAFDEWRARYIRSLPQAEEMIFAGTSDVTGRQRWVPATTKNLLKDMRRQEREESGTVAFGGHGKIWARWRPRITGMRELRGEAARVTRDEAEYERQKDALTEEILEIGRQIAQAVGRGDGAFGFDTGLDILMEAGPNEARLNRVASEYAPEPVELPSYLIDEIQEHFRKVGEMPLQFLEAKRIAEIPMSDVAAVVVPKVFPKRLRDQIEAQGVEVREKREDMTDEELAEIQSIPSALFKRAWHGSPHKFDRFSTEGIGSGEGAQVYGWGLYFADKEEVADWYRNALAPVTPVLMQDRKAADWDTVARDLGFWDGRQAVRTEFEYASHLERNRAQGDRRKPSTDQTVMELRAAAHRESQMPAEERDQAVIDGLPKLAAAISDGRLSIQWQAGAKYKVDLAPKDGEYLYWDRALDQQSEGVRAAVDKVWGGLPGHRNLRPYRGHTGKEVYDTIARTLYRAEPLSSDAPRGWGGIEGTSDQRAASEALLAVGVRGIKYLDGSSRNRPFKEIKREFLAQLPDNAEIDEVSEMIGTGAFSPKYDEVLRRLQADDWLGFDYPAQAISAAYSGRLDQWDPSPELVAAVEATREDGTFNYVIFDDSDVAIEEIIYQRLQAQQDRAGGAGQAAPPGRVRIRLNRRYDEAREGVRGDLERIGRETFGKQFRFELAESITAPEGGTVPGAFDPANRIAYIALRADEAGMTGSLYHEGVHYLRNAGAFDKADGTPNAAWQTLERQAAQWRQDYGIDERYAGDVGAMDPEARERLLNEEAIAEALADYATRGRETGFGPTVRMALNRILRFFRALREGLRGRGFQTWEDVFEADIGRGRAGWRADAAQAPSRAELDRQLQTAWHASPHHFDQFSTRHIGSGEGAQVYGHGLYFADKRGVAEWYQEKFSPGATVTFGQAEFELDTRAAARYADNDPARAALREAGLTEAGADKYISTLRHDVSGAGLGKAHQALQRYASGLRRDQARMEARNFHEDDLRSIRELATSAERDVQIVDDLMAKRAIRVTPKKSPLYKVDLAPKDSDYLYWDRPLYLQPKKVRNAVNAMWAREYPDETMNRDEDGGEAYRMLGRVLGSDRAASEALLAEGVRGIKYLDQSSRPMVGALGRARVPLRETFNYVIFDDSDVAIQEIMLQRRRSVGSFQPPGWFSRLPPEAKKVLLDSGASEKAVRRSRRQLGEMLSEVEPPSRSEIRSFLKQHSASRGARRDVKRGVDPLVTQQRTRPWRAETVRKNRAVDSKMARLDRDSLWSRTFRAEVQEAVRYSDLHSQDRAINRANMEAVPRALKKRGWTVRHTSTDRSGRASSRYVVSPDGKTEVRLADHELPETGERAYRYEQLGQRPNWDEIVLIGSEDPADVIAEIERIERGEEETEVDAALLQRRGTRQVPQSLTAGPGSESPAGGATRVDAVPTGRGVPRAAAHVLRAPATADATRSRPPRASNIGDDPRQMEVPGTERLTDRGVAAARARDREQSQELLVDVFGEDAVRRSDKMRSDKPQRGVEDLELFSGQKTLFQRGAKEDPKAFDQAASDWSGVDLTGAAEEVVKDKDRMGGFAESVKAGLKGTTAIQDPAVKVQEEKTHKDLNLALRFLAPNLAWSKKYPAIHSLIKQGVETEKNMSIWIQRFNRELDRIEKPLSKDEFAQLTGIMFLGDAEQVTFTDEQLGRFNTTEKVRAAYRQSRRFLDKIGRFTEQHERAMALPLLTRRTTLVRQMAGERGMDRAEFRDLYNARAELLGQQRRGAGDPRVIEFEIAEATESVFGGQEAPSELFLDRLKETDRLETRIADTKVRRREGYVPHKFFGRWRIFQAAQPNDEIEPYMGRGGTGFKDRKAAEKVAEASEGGILEGATPVQVDGKWGLEPKWKEVAGEHGLWKTRTDAVRAASHMARESPDAAEIRVVPVEFEFPHDSATTLGDTAYFTFRSNVERLTGLTGEQLNEVVTGAARRPFRRRIAGFLQYRTGMTGYSLDLDRVLRTHVGETVRYVSLDKLKFDAINTMEKEGLSAYRSSIQDRPVLAAAVQAWFRDVNGQKQTLESQIDNVLNKSWVTPLRAGFAAGALGFLAAGGPFNAPISPIVGAYIGYRVGRGLAQGGDFKTRAITGAMLGDMAHLKLGAVFNLMSALVNTTQVPLNTLPVLGFRDTTEGMIRYQKAVLSKLRGKPNADWRFLERMDINPLDTFAEGTRHKFKKESMLSKVSMVFFTTAEGFNRGVTSLGAMNKAQRKGWSHKRARDFANETLDRTQFHYGASDKPELLRNVLLRVPLQFKNFVAHQLAFVFGLKRKELPLFLLSMALTAGALGIPGLDFVDTLTDWLFDFSPIAMMKEAALDAAVEGELEGGIATFLTRGVPGLAGVDMTGRVGMGDKFLPLQFRDWKGPWVSTIENAVRHGREGAHWTHQMRNLSPGLGNPLVVMDAWENGGQVRSPWKRNRPEYVASETELIQKLVGARPIREARLQDLRDIERRDIERYRTDTRRYIDRIVAAMDRGDRAAAMAVWQEAMDAGIPISSASIRRGIQDFGTQRALREFDRLPRTMKPEGMGRRQAIERMAQ